MAACPASASVGTRPWVCLGWGWRVGAPCLYPGNRLRLQRPLSVGTGVTAGSAFGLWVPVDLILWKWLCSGHLYSQVLL